jgi:hypothetical protein
VQIFFFSLLPSIPAFWSRFTERMHLKIDLNTLHTITHLRFTISHLGFFFEAKTLAERFSDPVCIARMYGIATTQMYMFRQCIVNASSFKKEEKELMTDHYYRHFILVLLPSLSQPHRGVSQKAPQLPMHLPNSGLDTQHLLSV